jgi:soluble lytic murein transglycosylase-like protein
MRALAKTESGFDPKQTSVNKKGKKRSYCRGVYQILDSTAKSFCKINDPKLLYNYQINIKCGFKYFKHLLKKYKRYDNAVLAFNAGAVYKNEKGIPFNIQYLIRVRSNKN